MGIVSEKMSKHMSLIKEYQKDHDLGFVLSLNDATEEQIKNNTIPIFEVKNKKMGKTEFFELIKKVEDKNFQYNSKDEYILNGKVNVGYDGDKWNPKPIYKEYSLNFKCWNYTFDNLCSYNN